MEVSEECTTRPEFRGLWGVVKDWEGAEEGAREQVLVRLQNRDARRELGARLLLSALEQPRTRTVDWPRLLARTCMLFARRLPAGADADALRRQIVAQALRHGAGYLQQWLDMADAQPPPSAAALYRAMLQELADKEQIAYGDVAALDSELPTSLALVQPAGGGSGALRSRGAIDLDALDPVRRDRGYGSWAAYLKVYYDLFYADHFLGFVDTLTTFQRSRLAGVSAREALTAFDEERMAVFNGVRLHSDDNNPTCCREAHGQVLFQIAVRPRSARSVRMDNLSTGNLLALSLDGSFRTVVWFVIRGTLSFDEREQFKILAENIKKQSTDPNATGLLPQIVLDVSFCSNMVQGVDSHISYTDVMEALGVGSEAAVLVEMNQLYMSFGPTLRFLQECIYNKATVSPDFQDVFALGNVKPRPVEGSDRRALEKVRSTHPRLFSTLDPGQEAAYQHFLSNRLALVQGPPGTGKSYLTARLIYSLVHADPDARVLVVSYKNHALDDMLKDVVELERCETRAGQGSDKAPFDPQLVRLGNSKKMDPTLQKYTIACMNMGSKSKIPGGAGRRLLIQASRRLQAVMRDLQRPLEVDTAVFIQYFPEFADEVTGTLEGTRWWEKALENLLLTIRLRKYGNLATGEEDGEDDGSAKAGQGATEQYKQLDDQVIADSVDFQNAETARNRFYEMEEATDHIGQRIVLSNDSTRREEMELTLNDFAEAYPAKAASEVSHRWTTLPRNTGEQLVLLCEYFSRRVFELRKQLRTIGSRIPEIIRASETKRYAREYRAIRDKKMVFCTMTGCTIYHELVRMYQPTALVVEEAGEIPEPCIVSALLPTVKRVVMVGDHKQLPASLTSFELEKKNLQVSAFERLIGLGYEHRTLFLQNRMLDSLIWLMKPFYTQNGGRYESNMDRVGPLAERVPPVLSNLSVFWWTHTEDESVAKGQNDSICNMHEVAMVHNVCRALLTSDVDPSRLVVLTGYALQKREIQRCFEKEARNTNATQLKEIEVATIDEFQGNERDIVILSLVRTDKPGFMSLCNRIIVALSRQKLSLIIIGRLKVFDSVPEWKTIISHLQDTNAIWPVLNFKCPRHDGVLMSLDSKQTVFRSDIQFGFCNKPCGALLPCGHRCTLKCHSEKTPHAPCRAHVSVRCPACLKETTVECRRAKAFRCRQEMIWKCPEGHENKVECWAYQKRLRLLEDPKTFSNDKDDDTDDDDDDDTALGLPELFGGDDDDKDSAPTRTEYLQTFVNPCRCQHQCEKILPCGHRCPRLCGEPCPPEGFCPRCVANLKPKSHTQLLDMPQSEEERAAAAAAEEAVIAKARRMFKKQEQALTEEHLRSLLLYVCQLPRKPTETLLLKPWRMAAKSLVESDYFAYTQCDPLREATVARRAEVECTGGTLEYLVSALGIKVPDMFIEAPQCWLFLALASLLDRGLIWEVREIYHDWLGQCTANNAPYFVSRLPTEIGRGVRVLWNFLTQRKMTYLEEFQTAPMAKVAMNIIESLGAYRQLVLTKDMIRRGHRFGCMKGMEPCDMPIPPYHQVEKRELYLEENAGKAFVSVDLRRADYALLYLACPEWVARCPSWEEFVFTLLGEEEKRGSLPFFKHIEKLRMERTKLLGKLCHTKNVVLQSFVLCLIVRALLSAMEEDQWSIPAKCIYRFSCDELIIECIDIAHAKLVRDYVRKTISGSLPRLAPYTRVDAFILHKFDLTEDMLRTLQEARDVIDSLETPTCLNKSLKVYEGFIDEEWLEKYDTKTQPKNDKVYFVRETILKKEKTFAIKTLPRCLLPDAMPFVIQELVWKKKERKALPAPEEQSDMEMQFFDEGDSEGDEEFDSTDCVDHGDAEGGEESHPKKGAPRDGGNRGGGRGGARGGRGGNRGRGRGGNRDGRRQE